MNYLYIKEISKYSHKGIHKGIYHKVSNEFQRMTESVSNKPCMGKDVEFFPKKNVHHSMKLIQLKLKSNSIGKPYGVHGDYGLATLIS